MYRKCIKKLIEWKESADRKPLILKGARQVGKTWLLKEFGKTYYSETAYFNFDENSDIASVFENNKNPGRIVELLGLLIGKRIIPGETFIIFDEVQECPDALNALKYFNEEANEYHMVAAGSLLGTLLSSPKSYPVGKVNVLNVAPMTFDEFLNATDEGLYTYYSGIKKDDKIEEVFHKRLIDAYNLYLIVGGMPECVNAWINTRDCGNVLKIQRELIELYENDFAKYSGKINSGRILMVFRSIATQLAKANEKFIYGCVKEGARAREFEEAIEWLKSAGIVNCVYNVTKAEHPLNVYNQLNNFKLYLFDTGLLKCMAGIDNSAILLKSDYQFKGALSENYILQQIKNEFDVNPCFYSVGANAEIDFVIQKGVDIIPIEVKSGNNTNATSFKRYIQKYSPKYAIKFSTLNYKQDGAFVNIPMYLAPVVRELIF